MIRCTASSPGGDRLVLGLSYGNLDRMTAGDPAVVPLTNGRMVLACVAGEQALADVMSVFPGDHVVGLTPRTLQTLRDGHPVELQLAPLGISDFTGGFVFAGQSEFELIEALRATGLIDAATKFEGVEEYLQHERNAVEGCVYCRERRHQKNGVVFSPPAAVSWQARILAHPYLVMLGVLGLFALIGLVVSRWR